MSESFRDRSFVPAAVLEFAKNRSTSVIRHLIEASKPPIQYKSRTIDISINRQSDDAIHDIEDL